MHFSFPSNEKRKTCNEKPANETKPNFEFPPRPPHNATPSMEQALKNRLTFGPLMLAALFALLWLDQDRKSVV